LFAKLAVIRYLHGTTKIFFFDIVQYLNSTVEKFFEPHVCWLASQVKPSNDLVPKVGALGDGFKVILQALLEVLLGPLVSFVLAGTKVPFCDSHTLKAAAKWVKLLVHVLRVIFMILFRSHQELCFEVRYGIGQRVLGAKLPFVRGNVAGHFSSAGHRVDHKILMVRGWLMPSLIRFLG
jgi:hypothetical protein